MFYEENWEWFIIGKTKFNHWINSSSNSMCIDFRLAHSGSKQWLEIHWPISPEVKSILVTE